MALATPTLRKHGGARLFDNKVFSDTQIVSSAGK
jgi:hypothetical protein